LEKTETIALIQKQNRWWCEQTPAQGRLAGFWRFPHFETKTMKPGVELATFTYGITKYRVRLLALRATWKKTAPMTGAWLTLAEIKKRPFSAAHRRLFPFLSSV
jgi:adenine-specific DNA glycosylase